MGVYDEFQVLRLIFLSLEKLFLISRKDYSLWMSKYSEDLFFSEDFFSDDLVKIFFRLLLFKTVSDISIVLFSNDPFPQSSYLSPT